MLREIPVAYLVFDVLYAGTELLLDFSLRHRAQILDRLLANGKPAIALRRDVQSQLMFAGEEDVVRASVLRAPAFAAHSNGPVGRTHN